MIIYYYVVCHVICPLLKCILYGPIITFHFSCHQEIASSLPNLLPDHRRIRMAEGHYRSSESKRMTERERERNKRLSKVFNNLKMLELPTDSTQEATLHKACCAIISL